MSFPIELFSLFFFLQLGYIKPAPVKCDSCRTQQRHLKHISNKVTVIPDISAPSQTHILQGSSPCYINYLNLDLFKLI